MQEWHLLSRNPHQDCLSNGSNSQTERIWWCYTISLTGKFKLCKSLFTSLFLYGREARTLVADSDKKDSDLRNRVSEETSPHLLIGAQDQQLVVEQIQLPCESTGTSSGNCRETETCMVRECHTPRQPLQGEWATPLSTEEMLDRRHQRVDIPAHARTAHNGLL